MKPLMIVPPAQAEALYDAQQGLPEGLRLEDLRLEDRFAGLPWADDDVPDETLSYELAPPALPGDGGRLRAA